MDQSKTTPVQQPVAPPPSAPLKKSHMKTILFVLLGILFLAGMGAGGYYLGRTNINLPDTSAFPTQVSCTLEAKLCPDGTSVGRSGPKCEFICPTTSGSSSAIAADWKTYTNTQHKFSFKYPPNSSIVEIDNSSSNQYIVEVTEGSTKYKLDIDTDLTNKSKNYLGQPTKDKLQLNGNPNTWDVLVSEGYCDAGQCSEPFIVYQTIKDNKRYAFVFYNQTSQTDKQKEIVRYFTLTQ